MNKKFHLFLKLLIIGALAVVILVALGLIDTVISGRQAYRDEAVTSISASYASEQRIMGPVLVQPYSEIVQEETTEKGAIKLTRHYQQANISLFPTQLEVKGAMQPSMRRHGLYRVPVYEFQGTITGRIEAKAPNIKGDSVQYGIPYLAFTVKDARGIVGRPIIKLNGVAAPVLGAVSSSRSKTTRCIPSSPGAPTSARFCRNRPAKPSRSTSASTSHSQAHRSSKLFH